MQDLKVDDIMTTTEVAKKPSKPAYVRTTYCTSKSVVKTYVYDKELKKVIEVNGKS